MKILRYLLEHKLAMLMIVVCFTIQAYCDLSLPNYTSDIVDVGIQQSGIEDAAPEVLTESTYYAVDLLVDDAQQQLFEDSYTYSSEQKLYLLNDAGQNNRASLDAAVARPMVIAYLANQSAAEQFSQVITAYKSGALSKAQIVSQLDAQLESLGTLDDSVVEQQALVAAKAEYEAAGYAVSDMQMDYLVHTGLSMLLVALVAFLVHIIMNFFACTTATKIGRDLRERFFRKVLSFSNREVEQYSAASLITRGTNDIQQIQMLCVMAARMVIYTPIICIGGIYMVIQTNVSMSWIIALAVVCIVVVMTIIFGVTMPRFKLMQTLIDKVNLVAREMLTGVPVIRAFNRERVELNRFDTANTNLMDTQLFTNRAMAFMGPSMMLIMNATSALIIWVGGHYVDYGTVQTGDLIAFITYSMVIVGSFLAIGMIAIMMPRADVSAGRINEVIDTAVSIEDALQVYDQDLSSAPGAQIEFQDVCFSYAEDSKNVLDHVSFSAPAGKTTAIIGSTGSGKSTVLKLMERFYDVSSGQILLDGVDIRDLSQKKLRSTFGYVPQQAFLFSGTVKSNVGYASTDIAEDRISEALDMAQMSDFIQAAPEGLAAPIAQGGTNVSGGQRQRLAIARALATDARAFLFDDSFSALDYKTDALLRRELNTRLSGKTKVIVAQRIATVIDADQILVLDEGILVGQGTHQELLRSCQAYQEIAYSQLSEEELSKGGDR